MSFSGNVAINQPRDNNHRGQVNLGTMLGRAKISSGGRGTLGNDQAKLQPQSFFL